MKNGFTLIEILVVTTILALLIGGSIAGYSRFNEKQKLVQAGGTMKNVLRDAQSRAFTGEYAGCPTPPNALKGWQVDFNNNSISAVCTTPTALQPTIKYDLRAVVTVSANPTGILFTSFPKGATTATVCLSQSGITPPAYKITVDGSGTINDIGPTGLPCP